MYFLSLTKYNKIAAITVDISVENTCQHYILSQNVIKTKLVQGLLVIKCLIY